MQIVSFKFGRVCLDFYAYKLLSFYWPSFVIRSETLPINISLNAAFNVGNGVRRLFKYAGRRVR